jgi:hypothetical protein
MPGCPTLNLLLDLFFYETCKDAVILVIFNSISVVHVFVSEEWQAHGQGGLVRGFRRRNFKIHCSHNDINSRDMNIIIDLKLFECRFYEGN